MASDAPIDDFKEAQALTKKLELSTVQGLSQETTAELIEGKGTIID